MSLALLLWCDFPVVAIDSWKNEDRGSKLAIARSVSSSKRNLSLKAPWITLTLLTWLHFPIFLDYYPPTEDSSLPQSLTFFFELNKKQKAEDWRAPPDITGRPLGRPMLVFYSRRAGGWSLFSRPSRVTTFGPLWWWTSTSPRLCSWRKNKRVWQSAKKQPSRYILMLKPITAAASFLLDLGYRVRIHRQRLEVI